MKNKLEVVARVLFYSMLVAAPFGTRYIFAMAELGGVEIEPGTFSLFGTQILALLFLLAALFSGRFRQLTRLCWWAMGGATLVFCAAMMSVSLSGDARGLVMLNWLFFSVGILAATYKIRPSLSKSLAVLSVGGVVQALFSIWQFVAQGVTPSKWLGMAAHLPEVAGTFVVETAAGRWLRAYGTLPHPNMLGIYLAVAALASLYLSVSLRGRWRGAALSALALNVVGLTLSMSRSAILAFVIALAIFVSLSFLLRHSGPKEWRLVIGAVGVAMLTLVASLALLRDPATVRLLGRGRLEKISVESRFNQLDDVRLLLADSHIFGIGPGMMPFALYERDRNRSPWDYQPAHMTPLLLLVEIGALGALAYLMYIGGIFAQMIATLKRGIGFDEAALYSSFIAIIVTGLFDHFPWSSWFGQLLTVLLAGLILSVAVRQTPNNTVQ
ncbi:MAG: O-antigen ligase family protein [Patescibacteria group bacterium]